MFKIACQILTSRGETRQLSVRVSVNEVRKISFKYKEYMKLLANFTKGSASCSALRCLVCLTDCRPKHSKESAYVVCSRNDV